MEEKKIPPAELSLKYMAWDVKQMGKQIEKIADIMSRFLQNPPQGPLNPQQEEMPF
jgi:hypothetical protein